MFRIAWCAAAVMVAALADRPAFQADPVRDELPAVTYVRLDDVKSMIRRDSGNVVLVNAWASWCKPCQEEMPGLLRLRTEMAGRSFRMILVSIDDPDSIASAVRPALRKLGVDFPTYLLHGTPDEAFIDGMDSTWNGALPATFLYDRAGRLADRMVGGKSYQKFQEAVGKLLVP